MKLAALFSGGKDSMYAAYKASKDHELVCLLTMRSENKDSYMFHTPNISLTSLQAEAMRLPLLEKTTQGKKEEELNDLKELIKEAKARHKIEGIVTGAVESVYQATRIQTICAELNLWCFNPLWQMNQVQLLKELLHNNFDVIISSVAAYPLEEEWLGRKLDEKTIEDLTKLAKEFKINPAGEGGETESLVLNCPLFKKRIGVTKATKDYENFAGVYAIQEATLK